MRRDDMETFVRVVSRRSFAQAARELGLSPAAITRRILLLEQHLDVKLLNRNTRQVALTEAGTRYFSFAKRIMEEIRTEEFEISRMKSDVEGSLKVLVSKSFGNLYMGRAMADFMLEHSKIQTSVVVSDVSLHSLDPIEEGFDLAIRLGEPQNTRLFGKTIGVAKWIACASAEYIAKFGEPLCPQDLSEHSCIIHQMYLPKGHWEFKGDGQTIQVNVMGHASTNSVIVGRDLALSGIGVTLLPVYCVADDLKSGALKEVLSGFSLPTQTIRALYAHSSVQPLKVQLFVSFLQRRFRSLPL